MFGCVLIPIWKKILQNSKMGANLVIFLLFLIDLSINQTKYEVSNMFFSFFFLFWYFGWNIPLTYHILVCFEMFI